MGIPAIVAIYKGKWWWIGGFQHISSILHHGIHFDQAVSKSALANSSTQRSAWHAWLQIKWSWQLFAVGWQMLVICVLRLGPSCQNRHGSPIGPFLIGHISYQGLDGLTITIHHLIIPADSLVSHLTCHPWFMHSSLLSLHLKIDGALAVHNLWRRDL